MKHILPGLHTFTGLLVGRVYVIQDPDGLTLIDAGLTRSADLILQQIERGGKQPHDVKRILITHAHADHVGGLQALQRATGASVYASALEKPVIEGTAPIARANPADLGPLSRRMLPPDAFFPGTPVDHVLADGDVIEEVMGGLHVLETPGHAPGHLSFWQPDRRILFCGDTVLNLPFLRQPIRAFSIDMGQNRRSIGRESALNPAVICFGHGEPLMQYTATRLRKFARKIGAAE